MKITKIILLVLCLIPYWANATGYSAKDSVKMKEVSDFDRNLDKMNSTWHPNPGATDGADLFSNIDSSKALADHPDTFYINRLKKVPSVIGLTYNRVVKSCIQIYTVRKRNKFEQILGLKDYYFPMFEEILDQYGLPLELKYLSVIESALNPRAVSHCGATGLWQFMFGTARQYHMNIDTYVDERRDAYASTHAAAQFLRDLYSIYHDWVLVIAAYNCGPGNVNKAIRRSGGKTNYWDIYNYLPKETRGYFPAFIAAIYSINFYKDHSLTPKYGYVLPHSDTLVIKDNIHFQQVADILKVPVQQLRDLNPQYRRDIVPGTFESCKLRLPSNYVSRFISFKDSIVRYRNSEFFASDFKVINPGNSHAVDALEPVHHAVADNSTANSAKVVKPAKKLVKVRKGETLAQIAKLYHVSSADLKEWNNLSSGKLKVGKALIVYVSTPNSDEKTGVARSKKEENSKTVASTNSEANNSEKEGVKSNKEEKTSSKRTLARSKKDATSSKDVASAVSKDNEVSNEPSSNKGSSKNRKKELAHRGQAKVDSKASEDESSAKDDKSLSKKTLAKSKKENGKAKNIAKTASEEQSSSEEAASTKKIAGKNNKKEVVSKTLAKASKNVKDVEESEKSEPVSKKVAKTKKDEKTAKTVAKVSKDESDNASKGVSATSEKSVAKNTKAGLSKKGKNKEEFIIYEVKKGDTLYKIASKYPGVTGKDLMAWNELDESKIHPGQTIKIKKVN